MADDAEAEVSEAGLTPEQQAIKDKVEAAKVDLKSRLKAQKAERAAEAPVAKTRPKDFNVSRQPAGCKVVVPDDQWQTIHGDDPNQVWLKRGMKAAPEHECPWGEAPCKYCGALRQRSHRFEKLACLGCGIPVGE